ncbi:MAG: lectin-like protein [Planctomycetota bacterium]
MRIGHGCLSALALTLTFLSASPVAAQPVRWSVEDGGNDSYYEFIADTDVSWGNSFDDASELSFRGQPGRLVDITSAEENEFVRALTDEERVWIGLTNFCGDNRWVGGERPTYTNFGPTSPASGLPFFYMGEEGQWHSSNGRGPLAGYIVEYEVPDGFDYRFDEPTEVVEGQIPTHSTGTVGPSTEFSSDVPLLRPSNGGSLSIDTSAGTEESPSGIVTERLSLLSNAEIRFSGGFTMEASFNWSGGGEVNTIIDYAGTERLAIEARPGGADLVFVMNDRDRFVIGPVTPNQWHYAAIVFEAPLASCVASSGAIDGTLRCYFDCADETRQRFFAEKTGFGDSLARPIGIGQHPLGVAGRFFDGRIYAPRVALGELDEVGALQDTALCPFEVPPTTFVRGDATGDGSVDLSDGVRILNILFLGEDAPDCHDTMDTNDDGNVELSDAVRVFSFLFLGGSPPAQPFMACGADSTEDDLPCTESSAGCPTLPNPCEPSLTSGFDEVVTTFQRRELIQTFVVTQTGRLAEYDLIVDPTQATGPLRLTILDVRDGQPVQNAPVLATLFVGHGPLTNARPNPVNLRNLGIHVEAGDRLGMHITQHRIDGQFSFFASASDPYPCGEHYVNGQLREGRDMLFEVRVDAAP